VQSFAPCLVKTSFICHQAPGVRRTLRESFDRVSRSLGFCLVSPRRDPGMATVSSRGLSGSTFHFRLW
jgi:hypothetical protein